jgi:hypothetical protein
MFYEEPDLIPALRVTDKTFVVPESILALKHRKGRVLIVVPQTARGFLRVLAESEPCQ